MRRGCTGARPLAALIAGCCAASAFADSGLFLGGNGGVRPPVVLVPGIVGSSLEVRLHDAPVPHWECTRDTYSSWKKVWVDPALLLVPRWKNCLVSYLTLTYNASSDTYSNLPGLEMRTRGFGKDEKVDMLYRLEFGTLLGHLEGELGYEAGRDLFLAPYDWRLAGDAHAKRRSSDGVGGFYAELQEMIEQGVSTSGRKAVVVSHSLGCPTMLHFLHTFVSEEWRAEHIQEWVALAGPWLGSAMQAKAYLSGYTLGAPQWLISHDYVKSVQVNSSSGVWLSPSPLAFGDTPLVTTPSRNYSAKDLTHLIALSGAQAGGEQALALHKKLKGHLESLQRPPANVPTHIWYSTGVSTPLRFEYALEVTEDFNEVPINEFYGDGDGTVNIQSLRYPELHWPRDSSPFSTKVFPDVSHTALLSDPRFLKALTERLRPLLHPAPSLRPSPLDGDLLSALRPVERAASPLLAGAPQLLKWSEGGRTGARLAGCLAPMALLAFSLCPLVLVSRRGSSTRSAPGLGLQLV